MSMSESEEVVFCGKEYRNNDGEYVNCDRVGKYPDERCGFHSDYSSDGSANNYIHGLKQNRSKYYEEQSPEDKLWIDTIVDSFLDNADFDETHTGKITLLRNVAIDLHKKRRADEHIELTGMTQTDIEGFHEEYGPITQTRENVLHLTADRLSRTSLRILKELGVLDDPDTKKAESNKSLIEALSNTALGEDDE